MWKKGLGICVLVGILGLTGCSQSGSGNQAGSSPATAEEQGKNDENAEIGMHSEEAEMQEGNGNSNENKNQGKTVQGALKILSMDGEKGCSNENGYYYFTEGDTELKDGSYGYHMMYMDYATRQEVYLCNNTACTHDTVDCTSVFSIDEIAYDSVPFFYGDALYLLSKEYDSDGTISVDYMEDSDYIGEDVVVESKSAALYRMNPDGTGRSKVYDFGENVTLEQIVLGDDTGLYFVTKELKAEQSGNSTYVSSMNRNLTRLDVSTWKAENVIDLKLTQDEKETDYQILGAYDSNLILINDVYDRKLSNEEIMDDNIWKESYKNSKTQFALLNLEDGSLKIGYTIKNAQLNSYVQKDSMLYISTEEDKAIRKVDLESGKETVVAELEQSLIWSGYGEVLCCGSWDGEDEAMRYYVPYDGGEIKQNKLANLTTGWGIIIKAETEDAFLVIYDYEAEDCGDGSYEILKNKYALISKEDFYAGKENYIPIQMVGKGM